MKKTISFLILITLISASVLAQQASSSISIGGKLVKFTNTSGNSLLLKAAEHSCQSE